MAKYKSDTPASEGSLNREFMPTALDFTSVYKPSPRTTPTKAMDTVTGKQYAGEDRNQKVTPGDKMLGQGGLSMDRLDGEARPMKAPKFKADIDFGKQNQNP